MSVSISPVLPNIRHRPPASVARPAVGAPRHVDARAHLADRVLPEAFFRDAVVRERKRADRHGPSFGVVVVTQDHAVTRDHAHASTPVWGSVLRAAAAAKREVDVEGWLDEGVALGLLLPDISSDGAGLVARRLQHEVTARLGDRVPAALSIRLHWHPAAPGSATRDLPPVDALLAPYETWHPDRVRDAVKRAVDILGSLLLMALFAPVMLAALIAVKWTSPGPALFRQSRVGQRGRPFTMLKFRTMYVNAGNAIHRDYMNWFITASGQQKGAGGQVYKLTNDPRITPVGRILRKTSIDELPQFWNVLRGEMSLVGPRPPLQFEVDQYQPWHRRRVLEAKPGVTGLWQVNGRSRTTFDEMVRLDLRYARTHSLWMDLKILAATPAAMISGKGAC